MEFGVSYGIQTVLVSDYELVCDGEEHLHCSDTVLQPFVQGALQGDDMTFPNLGSVSHGTPPLVDGHGLCGVYHTPIFLCVCFCVCTLSFILFSMAFTSRKCMYSIW